MDDQGNKRDLYDFSSNFTQIITDATASFISDGKYVITGTYSSNNSTTSEGMYFSIVNNGAIELIKFYNFLDLDNFTNYLSEKAQNKIEAKKKRKEKKGKEYNLQYLLAPHNVILVDDGYIYLAEAYYPTYRTEYYTTTTVVNGVSSTVTRSSTVFDGYQYTHAFLAKFNKDGQKQWDQSFPMQLTYKTYSVKRFINIADNQQNSIKLVFSNGKNIYSKKFSFDGEVLQDKESSELETEISGDKTKRSYSSMRYWYDDYFLAYGTQVIKNTENSKVDRKRKVFFVNKLKYE